MMISNLGNGNSLANSWLNPSKVKEGVKNVASSVTFLFGIVTIYDLVRKREVFLGDLQQPKWVHTVNKVIVVCAKISLVLSAGVSRPGVYIISSLSGGIFSTSQLDKVFGPNTIFAINPWHPRHVTSIAAVILGLPFVIQSTYRCMNRKHGGVCKDRLNITMYVMLLFNTLTSRPVLHLVNNQRL